MRMLPCGVPARRLTFLTGLFQPLLGWFCLSEMMQPCVVHPVGCSGCGIGASKAFSMSISRSAVVLVALFACSGYWLMMWMCSLASFCG